MPFIMLPVALDPLFYFTLACKFTLTKKSLGMEKTAFTVLYVFDGRVKKSYNCPRNFSPERKLIRGKDSILPFVLSKLYAAPFASKSR